MLQIPRGIRKGVLAFAVMGLLPLSLDDQMMLYWPLMRCRGGGGISWRSMRSIEGMCHDQSLGTPLK
jgi:hypothetical protein